MPISRTDSVQFLKGVGPARVEALAELGVRTVEDLLFYFPRDLAFQPATEPIAACLRKLDQVITVSGAVGRCRWGGWARPVFSATVFDPTGSLDLTWFNAGWMKDRIGPGTRLWLSGRLRRGPRGPQLTNPKFTIISDAGQPVDQGPKWEPVYPASAKISNTQIRRIVQLNLPRTLHLIEELFPPAYLRKHDLLDRRQAVVWMHFPAASPQRPIEGDRLALDTDLPADQIKTRTDAARRRLAWDEAFVFQLALALRRRVRQSTLAASPLPCDRRIGERILRRFPFPLTAAQTRATEQIAADLAQAAPMNRLLQGDVGSGKTVVALFAALLAVAHGQQAAIMAPTEILARQHFERISQYLRGSRVRFRLLTGSLPAAERTRIREQLTAGQVDLVVGTTALISQAVRFARLALAVVDEQHKFGVYQRTALGHGSAHFGFGISDCGLKKPATPEITSNAQCPMPNPQSKIRNPKSEISTSPAPHLLVMTATPIPRSLALTVFGDLAVSVLDESPAGRGRIDTRVVSRANRDVALNFIASRLARGGQAFFVCPRIGAEEEADADLESDGRSIRNPKSEIRNAALADSTASAEQAFRELRPRFARFGIDLVHGQMSAEQQQRVLADFAAGKIRALVATTVIEVGVDIPKANVMAVLSAERFGLAQLHQLRGRIGRASDSSRSYCLLFADGQDEEALDRLRVLERTRDGFRIAEEDLARRGPGQFFGPAQHGLPEFKIVNLIADLPLIRAARKDAFALVAADPALGASKYAALRRQLRATYGDSIGLIDAG